ncbi:MAG: formate--tetrahydrofolate ligase [Clostridiales Family XIII bacterium]|jgi:formate--tetrahydrofolate ligase|nr:formate--tetrahydrofolate ligase [Clostridiales Family XIII bacterium]
MKTDIEIAQENQMENIYEIAEKLNIPKNALSLYGNYKAKIDPNIILHEKNENKESKRGHLILVTAMSPTPFGEGKTTTSIGLADGFSLLKKKVCLTLREPSLGPVFGVKGGAAGGGYAQVVPMEDINLHFTGDIHAMGAANNLLAAMIDNHIFQGNTLNIDSRKITWNRALDMNDRQLRFLVNGLMGDKNGVPREDSFDITVASEVMAVLCLSKNISDLKKNLGNIIIGYSFDNKPIRVKELKAEGAMATLLKDAIKPNLVQTLEGTPAIIHGGPFANIAHGCNSIIATNLALSLSDYCITEAGFGADLGAEKFLDIKCRKAGLRPSAVVIVATIRALKHHGGASKENLSKEDLTSLNLGFPNLIRHINNIKEVYNLPVIVAINRFPSDTENELLFISKKLKELNVNCVLSEVFSKGGEGGKDLAKEVIKLCEEKNNFTFSYPLNIPIEEKIYTIATKIYGAKNINILPPALAQIEVLNKINLSDLPICIAKTQYSFSDDMSLLGAPEDFILTVRDIKVSAGAGFIVAITGNIMTMPGLPKTPAAEKIDIDEDGLITGLF